MARDGRGLAVDGDGLLFAVDDFAATEDDVLNEADGLDRRRRTRSGTRPPEGFTADGIPIFHSKAGSPHVLYLDFNGHVHTQIRPKRGWVSFKAQAFNTDGNPNGFGSREREDIMTVWDRVSEDYSPFDVDVTTEEPAVFDRNVAHVVITHSRQANTGCMPECNAGGVAFLGTYGRADYHTIGPALVYYNNLANNPLIVAEACSHESGHNFGLGHHGTATREYFSGDRQPKRATSWGPIMGSSYGNAVTQWSHGSYPDADNAEQDDVAMIAASLAFRPDDTGATVGTARACAASGPSFECLGIIERRSDNDMWQLPAATAAGLLVVEASPFFSAEGLGGGNLDIELLLFSSNGQQIAGSSPDATTTARISVNVAAGTYYARVGGVGAPSIDGMLGYDDYASLGQYRVSGTVPGSGVPEQDPGTTSVTPATTTTMATTTAAATTTTAAITTATVGAKIATTTTTTTTSKNVAPIGCQPDQYQPNNRRRAAFKLNNQVGGLLRVNNVRLCGDGDVDYFRIRASRKTEILLEARGSSSSSRINIKILDRRGRDVQKVVATSSTTFVTFTPGRRVRKFATFYIKLVRGASIDDTTSFVLDVLTRTK